MTLIRKEQEQVIYEEKVKMLINISHELRTPLTLIMAPLKRLLTKMNQDDVNYEELSRIYRQSRRMNEMLNMVLDLRKMEEGNRCLKIESVQFNKWISTTIEDLVKEEKAEHIYIDTEFDGSIDMVELDKQKFDTILSNILMNAIKHSPEESRITLRTRLLDDGMVRVSISDQGPGILESDFERLFARFYQSEAERLGSGLGLAYSKILVEMHGGTIGFMNNEDKGATFWWEIPVKATYTANEPIPARPYLNELLGHDVEADFSDSTEGFSTSHMRVMLVDDNKDLLDFLKEAMTGEFGEIITATSGNKAISMLSSGRLPDIIVSDVNMPDGDGYKLCHEIKNHKQYSSIPIVLLTAKGEEQSQGDSYRAGADGFLGKPFEMDTLNELLKSVLKRREEIRKKYLDVDEAVHSDSFGSNEESFIIRLNQIISEHMDDPELDQHLLCMELGISRAGLYNKMKGITGGGTKEYITRLRIEKAQKLIESGMSFTEIAEKTGFSNQSYFSTAFKHCTGLTPTQYKKEHAAR